MKKIIDTLFEVAKDFLRFFNLKTKKGQIKLGVLLTLIVVVVVFGNKNNQDSSEAVVDTRQVTVGSVESLNTTDSFSLIGSVESQNQAIIQAETSGRVTRVNTELGKSVSAGSVIAELENSSQYAALLQAQGAYEAALASAEQSKISVEDAKTNLLATQNSIDTTLQNTYSTTNSVVLDTIDQFFSNLNSAVVGVRIDVDGNELLLVTERKQLSNLLNNWSSNLSNSSLAREEKIFQAINTSESALALLDSLIFYTNKADETDSLNGYTVNSYTSSLNAQRNNLVSTITSLNLASTNLTTALDAVKKAEIAGASGSTNSIADAQVKQALGSLRAAEANYQKTILRSPISGTVNELKFKAGDYVNIGEKVALVANNDALLITTYAGENDATKITVGQEVALEEGIVGIVVAIAPSIDTLTKKTEVKIASESTQLKTGDTINVSFKVDEDNSTLLQLYVPITAIKFTATDGYMYKVVDGKLESFPVTVGSISGSLVEILEGLELSTEFVLDARGLTTGQAVEII